MAPNVPNNYPLTKGLFSCLLSNTKCDFLSLDSLATLAQFRDKHLDTYLKEVMRYLKDPFHLFPEIITSIEFAVRVCSAHGTRGLRWKLPLENLMRRQHLTMLQALEILSQALLQSRVLVKNIQLLAIDPNENENNKLKKLEQLLLELVGFLDEILLFYSYNNMHGSENMPNVDKIKQMAKKLYKTIKNMDLTRLNCLIPKLCVREDDILCSVLGLQDNVADRLADLKPDTRSHQSDMYFILCFLEEDADYSGSLTDTAAMSTKLQELGFTENRSVVVAEWISQQPFPEHQSLMIWAQEYIKNLFMYNIFLNDNVSKYPYEEKKIDKWFSHPIDQDEEGGSEDNNNVHCVQVINTVPGKVPQLIDDQINELQSEVQTPLYFHGTDHNGAKSILEDGIDLEAGKHGCDFSDGCGFYLTDSADYAVDWTCKYKARAVLMFKIINNSLDQHRGLDLTSSKPDWKKVTNYYHKGKKGKEPLKGLNNYPYIMGPMSRDGTNKYLNATQLCIKKEGLAKDIGTIGNICGVLFF